MNSVLTIKTLPVIQNNQEFLIGVFAIKDILKFTRYTQYTILGFDEEKNNEPLTNKEVQRKLSVSKVKEIAHFLIYDDLAVFPTNLVVSIPLHAIQEQHTDGEFNIIHLKQFVFDEIAKLDQGKSGDIYLSIIDGQHRIKGIQEAILEVKNSIKTTEKSLRDLGISPKIEKDLKNFKKKLENLEEFQLPVSFFIDPVLEYQAMIFSTINRTQTKVPADLVYSLFGLEKGDSPQKTALNIVNTLNGHELSAFYKRIRLAGSKSTAGNQFYEEGHPVLSQATVVKSILLFISKSTVAADQERRYRSRKHFLRYPDSTLPFRMYYGKNTDDTIYQIVFYYFKAVQRVFVDQNCESLWDFKSNDKNRPTNILQTTIGFEGLMLFLKTILQKVPADMHSNIKFWIGLLSRTKVMDFVDNNDPKKFPFVNKTKYKIADDMRQLSEIHINTIREEVLKNPEDFKREST